MLTPVLAVTLIAALPRSVPLELFDADPRRDPAQAPSTVRLPGARARLDLGDAAALLRGSFVESSVDDKGVRVARLGYGVYLGKALQPKRGELSVHYELRRRGLVPDDRDLRAMPWNVGGGGLGIEGTVYLTPHVGLNLSASIGPSWSAGAALVVWGF